MLILEFRLLLSLAGQLTMDGWMDGWIALRQTGGRKPRKPDPRSDDYGSGFWHLGRQHDRRGQGVYVVRESVPR